MLDPWFKRYYPVKHLKKMGFWWAFEYATLRDARAVLFHLPGGVAARARKFLALQMHRARRPPRHGSATENQTAQQQAFDARFPELRDKRVFLFLGRLHVKKGCDLLLRGFLKLLETRPPETWRNLHLMMAGPCAHPNYLEELKQIAGRCEALSPGSVSFPGMLSGDLKWGTLRQAEVFILPSHQEKFRNRRRGGARLRHAGVDLPPGQYLARDRIERRGAG